MVAQNIIFFILGIVACSAAVGVVRTTNIVHAALFLVTVFASVAGVFLLIGSEFIAWVQVLIYIGAITVLLLFGIMLTKAPMGKNQDLDNKNKFPAYAISLSMLALLVVLVVDAFSSSEKIILGGDQAVKTLEAGKMSSLGEPVLYNYIFAFELVGILLLAALIGAVVMARKDS